MNLSRLHIKYKIFTLRQMMPASSFSNLVKILYQKPAEKECYQGLFSPFPLSLFVLFRKSHKKGWKKREEQKILNIKQNSRTKEPSEISFKERQWRVDFFLKDGQSQKHDGWFIKWYQFAHYRIISECQTSFNGF